MTDALMIVNQLVGITSRALALGTPFPWCWAEAGGDAESAELLARIGERFEDRDLVWAGAELLQEDPAELCIKNILVRLREVQRKIHHNELQERKQSIPQDYEERIYHGN